MAARGVPRTTVNGWYRDRARTGYPEKAGRIGQTDYWYEDEWTAWHEAHLRRKTESLTPVDRSGDPDDLVDAAEAACMLRYASRDVIPGRLSAAAHTVERFHSGGRRPLLVEP